jgi:LmbE family N-acetylglucosaminyl deacetylase
MRVFQRLLAARGRDLTASTAQRSCIVLAPHPDDETLGCGATIARKRAAGAEVAVVFATDGGRSHAGRADPVRLARRRREEAVRACATLGVPAHAVHFLGFEDGALGEHVHEAAIAIANLPTRRRPEELFVSTALDRHPDHVALRQTVQILEQMGALPARVYEYPVWFWAARAWREHGLRGALLAQARALALLRVRVVKAHPFLERKRAALRQHASQVVAPPDDPTWPTLAPALIERCCAPCELFFEQNLRAPFPAVRSAPRRAPVPPRRQPVLTP